jgi:hypothetical protein
MKIVRNLEYFYGATKEFSKKSPTLSTVFPVFIVIFSHVENLSSSNIVPQILKPVLKEAHSKLCTYYEKLDESNAYIYILLDCSILVEIFSFLRRKNFYCILEWRRRLKELLKMQVNFMKKNLIHHQA